MRNLKQVKETLNRFFKGSKEISGGLAKLLPYIAIFTTGVVTGSGPLTFAGDFRDVLHILSLASFEKTRGSGIGDLFGGEED